MLNLLTSQHTPQFLGTVSCWVTWPVTWADGWLGVRLWDVMAGKKWVAKKLLWQERNESPRNCCQEIRNLVASLQDMHVGIRCVQCSQLSTHCTRCMGLWTPFPTSVPLQLHISLVTSYAIHFTKKDWLSSPPLPKTMDSHTYWHTLSLGNKVDQAIKTFSPPSPHQKSEC